MEFADVFAQLHHIGKILNITATLVAEAVFAIPTFIDTHKVDSPCAHVFAQKPECISLHCVFPSNGLPNEALRWWLSLLQLL